MSKALGVLMLLRTFPSRGEELKSCDVPNSPNRRSLFKPGMVIDSILICLAPFFGNPARINCQKDGACQKFIQTVSACEKVSLVELPL